jgi:hypothetical protein
VQVPVEFVGFSIPDEFVVGYGIDYAQRYRHLLYVGKVVLLTSNAGLVRADHPIPSPTGEGETSGLLAVYVLEFEAGNARAIALFQRFAVGCGHFQITQ